MAAAAAAGEGGLHDHGVALEEPGRDRDAGPGEPAVLAERPVEQTVKALFQRLKLDDVAVFVDGQQGIPTDRAGKANLGRSAEPLAAARGEGDKAVALGGAAVQDQREGPGLNAEGFAVRRIDAFKEAGDALGIGGDFLREDDLKVAALKGAPGDAGRILVGADIKEIGLGEEGGPGQQKDSEDLIDFGHELPPGATQRYTIHGRLQGIL